MSRIILILILVFTLVGCGNNTNVESPTELNVSETGIAEWTVEDMYVFHLNGELFNYPENEELKFYDVHDKAGAMSAVDKETEYSSYQTKRGLKVGTPAKVILDKYDLSGFYKAIDSFPLKMGSGQSETTEQIEKDFFEKYPDINDAKKHTNELPEEYTLFLLGYFGFDENGNFSVLEINDLGYLADSEYNASNDCYSFTIKVRKDNIWFWSVEHTAAWDSGSSTD